MIPREHRIGIKPILCLNYGNNCLCTKFRLNPISVFYVKEEHTSIHSNVHVNIISSIWRFLCFVIGTCCKEFRVHLTSFILFKDSQRLKVIQAITLNYLLWYSKLILNLVWAHNYKVSAQFTFNMTLTAL